MASAACPVIKMVELDDRAAFRHHLKGLTKLCPSAQSASMVWQLLHGRVVLEVSGAPSSHSHLSGASNPFGPPAVSSPSQPALVPSESFANASPHVIGGLVVASPTYPRAGGDFSLILGGGGGSTLNTTNNGGASGLNWMLKHKSNEASMREVLSVWGLAVDEAAAEAAWDAFVTHTASSASADGTTAAEADASDGRSSPTSLRPSLAEALVAAFTATRGAVDTASAMPPAAVAVGEFVFFIYPPQLRRALGAMAAAVRKALSSTPLDPSSASEMNALTPSTSLSTAPSEVLATAAAAAAPAAARLISKYVWLSATAHIGQIVSLSLNGSAEEPISVRRSAAHPSQRCLHISDADVAFLCHELLPLALPCASVAVTHSDYVTDAVCEAIIGALCSDSSVRRFSLKGCKVAPLLQEEVDAVTACVRVGPPLRGELCVPDISAWVEEWGRNGLKNQQLFIAATRGAAAAASNGSGSGRGAAGGNATAAPTQGSPLRAVLSLRNAPDGSADPTVVGGGELSASPSAPPFSPSPATPCHYTDPSPSAALASLGRALAKVPPFVRHLSLAGGSSGERSVTLEGLWRGLMGLPSSSADGAAADSGLPLTSARGGRSAAQTHSAASLFASSQWHTIESIAVAGLAVGVEEEEGDGDCTDSTVAEQTTTESATDEETKAKAPPAAMLSALDIPMSSPLLALIATAPSLSTLSFSGLGGAVPMAVVGAICEAWQRRETAWVARGSGDDQCGEEEGEGASTTGTAEGDTDAAPTGNVVEGDAVFSSVSDEEGSDEQRLLLSKLPYARCPLRHIAFVDCDVSLEVVAYLAVAAGEASMGGIWRDHEEDGENEGDTPRRKGHRRGRPHTYSTILFDRCYFPPLPPGGGGGGRGNSLSPFGSFSAAPSPLPPHLMTPSLQAGGGGGSSDLHGGPQNGSPSLPPSGGGGGGDASVPLAVLSGHPPVSSSGSGFNALLLGQGSAAMVSSPLCGQQQQFREEGGASISAAPSNAPISAMDYLSPYLGRFYELGVRLEFRGCDGVPDIVVEYSA